MFDSPVHSDLDAALGVPGDQVVAGDDLVERANFESGDKGGDVGTVDEKSLPDQARSHGSQYPPPSPFLLGSTSENSPCSSLFKELTYFLTQRFIDH